MSEVAASRRSPEPIRRVTLGVVLVSLAVFVTTIEPAAGISAAVGGLVFAAGLDQLRQDSGSADIIVGITLAVVGSALAVTGGLLSGGRPADAVLVVLLFVIALSGAAIGRDVLSPTPISRISTGLATAAITMPLAALVLLGFPVDSPAVRVPLGLHPPRPAVGTALGIFGVSFVVVGVALSLSNLLGEQPRVGSTVRDTARRSRRLGIAFLVAGAITGLIGVSGVYDTLGTSSPFVYDLLALLSSSTALRVAAIGVALVGILIVIVRFAVGSVVTPDGLQEARLAGITGIVLAVALVPVTAVSTGDQSIVVAVGSLTGVLFVVSAALWILSMGADWSDTPGVQLCIAALLGAAMLTATVHEAVLAPIVAITAAAILFDVGRIGAALGQEVGHQADVSRSVALRSGASLAVGCSAALAALGGVILADVVGARVRGPIAAATLVALSILCVLLWYVRRRRLRGGSKTEGLLSELLSGR